VSAALLTILTSISLPAIADAGHNHGSVSSNGRFTPNSEGAPFPPQPRNATGVRDFSPSQNAGNRVGTQNVTTANASVAQADAKAAALADSAVQNALGARYAHISTVRVHDKWRTDYAGYRVTFFSHSNNQTVSVTHDDDELNELVVTPAAQKQPPLAQSEMTEAITIARDHWVAESNSRIAQLTGYAIQTYQDDGSPHLTRIVYVSFHTESPAAPELLTWVDLNSRRVTRAQEVQ
jgi:hypothetical protein